MIAGKAGAYLSEALTGVPFLDKLLALPAIIRLGWKGLLGTNALAYCENSEITDRIGKFVNYGQKKVYNIGPRTQCYRIYYDSNLLMFILKYSVCH